MNLTWHDVGIVYRQSNHLGFGSRDVDRYNSFWSIIKVAIVSPWIGQRDSSLWESMGKSSLIWVESKWYKIWMTKWLKPKQENWLNSLWNDSSSWIFVQVNLHPPLQFEQIFKHFWRILFREKEFCLEWTTWWVHWTFFFFSSFVASQNMELLF